MSRPNPLSRSDAAAPRSLLVGVACISSAIFIFELALTRIFSVTMFYHFAFLAISVALFGLSASGVYIHLTPGRHAPERLFAWLGRYALLFSAVTVGATVALLHLSIGEKPSIENGLILLVVYVVAAAPFFAGGACIALAVSRLHRDINRIYAADLAGGAAGCLVLISALDRFGGPGALLVAALLGAIASAMFSRAGGQKLTASLVAVGLLTALLGVQAVHPLLDISQAKGGKANPASFSRWNSFSRVAVYERSSPDWGMSETYRGPHPPSLFMDIDYSASTPILLVHDVAEVAFLKYELTGLAYHALKPGADVLIIGPGGGRDLWTALLFGARTVDAVELNGIIAQDVMSERLREASGDIYHRPGVSVVVDDGRSFIRRSQKRYDLIQATLVDTWAATAAGAFALSENNLYTVDAFVDYFQHLGPNGMLTMSRWDDPNGLRLFSLARAAAERLGWGSIGDRVFVARHRPPASMRDGQALCTYVFKASPFTAEELSRLKSETARLEFDQVYPLPLAPIEARDRDYDQLANRRDAEEFYRQYPVDISPTTDDRPFFFQIIRGRDLPRALLKQGMLAGANVLSGLLVISVVLVTLFILLPLFLARRSATHASAIVSVRSPTACLPLAAGAVGGPPVPWGYFACLGMGFMMVEMGQMQRFVLFLGHPVYALTVILFTLLLGGGIGSALGRRFGDPRRALTCAIPLVIFLGILYALLLPALFNQWIGLERPVRMVISSALLLPLGIVLGVPLPAGISLLAERRPEQLAWAWAVNGATSVLGATVAVLVAILYGFTAVAFTGAAVYALALVLGLRLSRVSRAVSQARAAAEPIAA
jgi:hypothetical protein